MNLSGDSPIGPITIREAPASVSDGQIEITDLGGGLYHIDSFFDVFTELTVDGGGEWLTADSPTRFELVPEPATICLFGLGILGLLKKCKT